MFWPEHGSVPPPNTDLSDEIQADYNEAAAIVSQSPRGATALLRLALQKLCVQLGKDRKNINDDIASLVCDGLPSRIQQMLDIVRVVGNEAVHPGELDLRDDVDTALALFALLNEIADNRISEPMRIEELYSTLPESKRRQIDERDRTRQNRRPSSGLPPP
jgi:hypothetical protein